MHDSDLIKKWISLPIIFNYKRSAEMITGSRPSPWPKFIEGWVRHNTTSVLDLTVQVLQNGGVARDPWRLSLISVPGSEGGDCEERLGDD